jgi:ABC-type amino acid transport system permease subunit
MEPWYNVFSYWGLVLWLLRPWIPFSVLAILIANLIGTIVFVAKARPTFKLGAFLVLLHAVPVWLSRRDPVQLVPLFVVFATYMLFLAMQGLTPRDVYDDLVRDPPSTIREYLAGRLLLKT